MTTDKKQQKHKQTKKQQPTSQQSEQLESEEQLKLDTPEQEPTQLDAAAENNSAENTSTEDISVENTDAKDTSTQDHAVKEESPAEYRIEQATPSQAETPKEKKSGRGLATVALLISLIALALSLWPMLQPKQEQPVIEQQVTSSQTENELESRLNQLNQLIEQQAVQLNQQNNRLASLPDEDSYNKQQRALRQMQSDYQSFSMRFEAAFGNTRQDWRLAEAEHLLRMAILRLNAMQDLVSARHLVEGADQILFEQDDEAAYPAREALSQALADIKAMPKLDRTGLFLRLGALQNQIAALDQLIPGFEQKTAMEKAADRAFWRQWLDSMSDYIRLDFDSSDDIKPLLASQELTHIRLAMSLAVEQAQWAALNGQQPAYDKALQQASALLQHYFSADNQKAAALLEQLQELSGQPVSQAMPDIQPALLALQAYIHDRTLQYRTRSEDK